MSLDKGSSNIQGAKAVTGIKGVVMEGHESCEHPKTYQIFQAETR